MSHLAEAFIKVIYSEYVYTCNLKSWLFEECLQVDCRKWGSKPRTFQNGAVNSLTTTLSYHRNTAHSSQCLCELLHLQFFCSILNSCHGSTSWSRNVDGPIDRREGSVRRYLSHRSPSLCLFFPLSLNGSDIGIHDTDSSAPAPPLIQSNSWLYFPLPSHPHLLCFSMNNIWKNSNKKN